MATEPTNRSRRRRRLPDWVVGIIVAALAAGAASYLFSVAEEHHLTDRLFHPAEPEAATVTGAPASGDSPTATTPDPVEDPGPAEAPAPATGPGAGPVDPNTPYTPTESDISTAALIFTHADNGTAWTFERFDQPTITWSVTFDDGADDDTRARALALIRDAFDWGSAATGTTAVETAGAADVTIRVVTSGYCCQADLHDDNGVVRRAELIVAAYPSVIYEEILHIYGPRGDLAPAGTSIFVESHDPGANLTYPSAFDAWLIRVGQHVTPGGRYDQVRAEIAQAVQQ